MKGFLIGVCAAALLGSPLCGLAIQPEQESAKKEKCGSECSGKGLSAELGLSKARSDEMKAKMQELRDKIASLKAERDAAMKRVDKLLEADSIDESAVWAGVSEVQRIEGEMMKARISARLSACKNLSSEEKKKMAEMRKKMEQSRRERMEKKKEHKDATEKQRKEK